VGGTNATRDGIERGGQGFQKSSRKRKADGSGNDRGPGEAEPVLDINAEGRERCEGGQGRQLPRLRKKEGRGGRSAFFFM